MSNHHTTMVVYRRDKNVRRSSATLTASANIFCDFREFFDLPEVTLPQVIGYRSAKVTYD
ncbi:unnamed protein product [Arabis nemorensis]|uniref:Uncharacterized protein n=1 Tax=Arabis nemorensis TaxID=586526 RepID=A0A565CVS8_9BRAS|nr:unnamed protein product [Arabis nemorensis]